MANAGLFSTPEQVIAAQQQTQAAPQDPNTALRAALMGAGRAASGAFGRGLGAAPPPESEAVKQARIATNILQTSPLETREDYFKASQQAGEAGNIQLKMKLASLGAGLKAPETTKTETFREKVVVGGKERVGLYNKDGGGLIRYLGEGEEKKDDKVFDKETQFRKEYQNKSKFYEKSVHGYDTIQASAKDPDAVGDLALIFAFMKVLDPESVVRESEFAVAENTAAKLDWFRKSWEKVQTGERLLPEQRQRFVSRAEKMMKVHNKRQDQLRGQYTDLSKRSNVDPSNVLVGLSATGETKPPVIVFAPQEQQWIDATKLANPDATEEEIIALGRSKGRIGAK